MWTHRPFQHGPAAVSQVALCHQSCRGLFHVEQIACPGRPVDCLLLSVGRGEGAWGGGQKRNLCETTWRLGLRWSFSELDTQWTLWWDNGTSLPPTRNVNLNRTYFCLCSVMAESPLVNSGISRQQPERKTVDLSEWVAWIPSCWVNISPSQSQILVKKTLKIK